MVGADENYSTSLGCYDRNLLVRCRDG